MASRANLSSRAAWVFVFLSTPALWSLEPMRLEQALKSALARATDADGSLALAQGQLHLQESLGRRKVELRPQLGLLSFSNPTLLAASVGSNLLFGQRGSVSPFAIQNARLDVLAAELTLERLKLRTEIETDRAFFDLLEKQQVADRSCQVQRQVEQRGAEIEKLIRRAKLTAVDRIRYEQELLGFKSECVEAESQRQLASVRLAALAGHDGVPSELRVEDVQLPPSLLGKPLPTTARLLELSFSFRSEPKRARERLSAIQQEFHAPPRFRFELFSLGYRYVKDTGDGPGGNTGGYLLGGHTFQPEVGFSWSLRDTGERAATQEITTAKINSVESELVAMEDEIKEQLETRRLLALAAMERVWLARRKSELASQARQLVAARVESGLADPTFLFSAEQETLRAHSGFTRADCEMKANLSIILALAGLHDQPAGEQERVFSSSGSVPQGVRP